MITINTLIDTIQKIPEPDLPERFELIKRIEATKKKTESKPGLMSKLRNIQISAPECFFVNGRLNGIQPKNCD